MGVVVIFTVFAGIIMMACFISAPQTVTGEIMLSSDNPSVQLSAHASGKLNLLLTPDDTLICEGRHIACVGKYADYERVMRAESHWRQSYTRPSADYPRIDSLPDDIQNPYTAFRLAQGTVLFEPGREALAAALRAWKAEYLLSAPVSGRLTGTAGRYVREGEPVARIIPEGEAGTIGRMQVTAGYDRIRPAIIVGVRIPVTEADKDRKRQGVVLRCVPLAGTESELVYIDFPEGLPESWHTILQIRPLHGTAEIVVKQHSLFQKFMPLHLQP